MGAYKWSHSFFEFRGKEYGLCYLHTRMLCDKDKGDWRIVKTPFGMSKFPKKDAVYFIRNDDMSLVFGPSGYCGRT